MEVKHSIGAVEATFFPGTIPNSWLGKVGSNFLYRASALSDYSMAEALFKEIEGATTPLRIAVLELSSPVLQWELSSRVHASLIALGWEKGLSAQSAVIHLPLDPFYTSYQEERPSEFLSRDFQRLTRLQNTDGWAFYGFWVAEMAEKVLEKIPLQGLELYTLEAHLKSYLHEVRTAMLRSDEWEIVENSLRVAALKGQGNFPVPEKGELVDFEKHLIRGRSESRGRLEIQQEILANIAHVVFQLTKPQGMLIHLGWGALLLSSLLERQLKLDDMAMSWGAEAGLIALLNRELGCLGVVLDEQGIDRVNLVFAIQAAWAALAEKYPPQEVIQAALQWDQTPYRLGGPLIEQLRQNVLAALEGLCLPMTQLAGVTHKMEWHLHKKEDLSFLKFLPVNGLIKNKNGEFVKAPLLVLDEKGEPSDLTPAGHYLMTKLQN